jgi:antitoxin component YwqK of YwqJK toxin-antitoxin module
MLCKHCGKEVQPLSKIGLCAICDYKLRANLNILGKSIDFINEAKKVKVLILSENFDRNRNSKEINKFNKICEVALEVLEGLKEFEHLNFIEPSPSQLITDVLEKRSLYIYEYWENYCGLSLSPKLDSYTSIDKVINKVEEIKKKFIEYEKFIQEPGMVEEIKLRIQSLISDYITNKYNKLVWEAKESNKELAIKKLNEALIIFENYKYYFGDGNRSIDVELKEWIEIRKNSKAEYEIENHKDWGKEYYLNGNIKAEWENQNYLKVGKYISYYRSGKIDTTSTYFDGVNRDGFVNKYFESGGLKELWSYEKGKRIFVKKYFESGELKTEWLYDKDGNEISKKYYNKQGNLIRK